ILDIRGKIQRPDLHSTFFICVKGPYQPFYMFEPNIFNFHTLFKLNKKRGVNVCLHRGI
ncbi:hypothetical protein LDENG_00253850, partial [Lucifuga dentata]